MRFGCWFCKVFDDPRCHFLSTKALVYHWPGFSVWQGAVKEPVSQLDGWKHEHVLVGWGDILCHDDDDDDDDDEEEEEEEQEEQEDDEEDDEN